METERRPSLRESASLCRFAVSPRCALSQRSKSHGARAIDDKRDDKNLRSNGARRVKWAASKVPRLRAIFMKGLRPRLAVSRRGDSRSIIASPRSVGQIGTERVPSIRKSPPSRVSHAFETRHAQNEGGGALRPFARLLGHVANASTTRGARREGATARGGEF